MTTSEPCKFLPWDSDFFNYRIAQVNGHTLTQSEMEAVITWCQAQQIDCLYYLADPSPANNLHLAENHGFRFMDMRVTYSQMLKLEAQLQPEEDRAIHIRSSFPADIPALQEIARSAYTLTRFAYDPCFSNGEWQSLYETWIAKSCQGYADRVLVAEIGQEIAGYVTCHLPTNEQPGQIGLVGIAPQSQGHGVGKILVKSSLDWFIHNNVNTVSVVTQGWNIAAQRLYQRCGFVIQSSQIWYHKWFCECKGSSRR